jgi:serine phosphatase RsbU (regulator of sigma subunit)/Tfp pilus assembly protein PilF
MKITLKLVVFALLFSLISCNSEKTNEVNEFTIPSDLDYGESKLDSLKVLVNYLETQNHYTADTLRVVALGHIGWKMQYDNPDSAIYYGTLALDLARKIDWKKGTSKALNNLGNYNKNISKFDTALELFFEGLEIDEEIKNAKGISQINSNIGIVYAIQGDYTKALEYFLKALKIEEENNFRTEMAHSFNNLVLVNTNLEKFDLALEYNEKAIKIYEEFNDNEGLASQYNSMGDIYNSQQELDSALIAYNKSLIYLNKINNPYLKGMIFGNIANLYADFDSIDISVEYYKKSMTIFEEMEDIYMVSVSLGNIGTVEAQKGRFDEAINYFNQALDISHSIGDLDGVKEWSLNLALLYDSIGDYKNSYSYFKTHVEYKDSIFNDENKEAQTRLQIQFEFDKKESLEKAEQAKKDAIRDKEMENERIIRFAALGGLLLVLVIVFIVSRSLRIARKQKKIIEIQKHEVEEKHREITDSINYAERIQRSFLATKDMLNEHLRDYFVFFKPKDVVSGDFYWAAQLNNGNFAFTVADSTGHGVPGAIMSILNISSLEKSIEKETEPNSILSETRKIIINRLKKDGSPEGGKDGMDCSLLVLNQDKSVLSFASANNPVFIVRKTPPILPSGEDKGGFASNYDTSSLVRSGGVELLEFKADKMPVGKHDKEQVPFTLQSVQLQKGDVIYTLTDGFPDQFGGEKGKKYMIKNLKELFLTIAHLPMNEQEQKLNEEFTTWKGINEQIDDVCIIGVRL